MVNDHLILISGKSATGKSMCLKDFRVPEGVLYLNCEAGKRLPFKAKFKKGPDNKVGFTITDPYQVYEAFDYAETQADIHTIVIDTATYMMEMFESVHVIGSANTMQMWGEYAQFFRNLMQQYVAKSTKNVVILAHTSDIVNDDAVSETLVKVKGSLMNQGIESFFSTVISTKKIPLKKLTCENDLLNVTDREKNQGFKYVFQTDLTKDTVNERIRGPFGLFEENELYIDNNIQNILDRLHDYYADE